MTLPFRIVTNYGEAHIEQTECDCCDQAALCLTLTGYGDNNDEDDGGPKLSLCRPCISRLFHVCEPPEATS